MSRNSFILLRQECEEGLLITKMAHEQGHIDDGTRLRINEEFLRARLAGVSDRLQKGPVTVNVNTGDHTMIKTRDITGSSVVTGYEHKVSTQYTLPPPNTVDVRAELAGLREFAGSR
jgi:hypothetical protein